MIAVQRLEMLLMGFLLGARDVAVREAEQRRPQALVQVDVRRFRLVRPARAARHHQRRDRALVLGRGERRLVARRERPEPRRGLTRCVGKLLVRCRWSKDAPHGREAALEGQGEGILLLPIHHQPVRPRRHEPAAHPGVAGGRRAVQRRILAGVGDERAHAGIEQRGVC
mgnify:CR=1 FL=1